MIVNKSFRWHLYQAICLLLVVMYASTAAAQDLKRTYPRSFVVEVNNPLNLNRTDVMVFLEEDKIQNQLAGFNPDAFVVLDGSTEIASQYNKQDPEKRGIVAILPQMGAGQTKKLTIRYKESGELKRNYTKRTQAELSHKVGGRFENRKYIGGEFKNVDLLRVPDEHTDHSYFIRYEGPGWESDKVGYRFYLDWRNGVDVFGKKTNEMVLQQVGLDGFDSYHEMQPWGMDILKVGKALGVGSLALFHEGKAVRVDKTDSIATRITENGAVYSSITTNYWGWKVAGQTLNLESVIGIHAGSRLTHQLVNIAGNPANISTGLTKTPHTKLHTSRGSEGEWGYLATWGKQTLNEDNAGLAILFRPKDLIDFTEDEHSHVVMLKPSAGQAEYYYLAAWELEKEGITTEAQFLEYLNKTAKELGQPINLNLIAK
ncbi:DUF4861 domain-containing protein [Cesiribacter sp. SM1]|uniref:DUF4861 domain-containing protein n=1 Tax=Cesiribacter sp. SM1 TaxID=2861196 RepID=UPI001CD494C8|nr:DUF4861 domain-containing protein [Cesiribacter sp. SM1]